MAAKRSAPPVELSGGPWPGVRDTTDPFDDEATGFLVDGINGYVADPQGKSGFYALPGFTTMNGGTAVYSAVAPFRGQTVYAHVALDGTVTNLVAFGGHLFRVDSTLTVFTDVTPVGVTINGAIGTRLKCLSLVDNTSGSLVISDGVNPPWIATNLASTPITGTYINYDGAGTTWSAADITAWGGSLIVLLNQLNGVALLSTIAWAEPGQPTVGFTQTGFSNFWTLAQTGALPIYAILGTNTALYYFRELSIGAITGSIGPNLATTATHDAIAFDIGTRSPQAVQVFGNQIFFVDSVGRPQMLTVGGTSGTAPTAIWKNLRAIVDASAIQANTINAVVAVSAFEPTLNQYWVNGWSPSPATNSPPSELYNFDGATGLYNGRLWLGAASTDPTGIQIEAIGTLIDGGGHHIIVALGSAGPGSVSAASGFAWSFNGLSGTAEFLVLEDETTFLTTNDGVPLTTNGQQAGAWTNNGNVPKISATTERLGYNETNVWNADRIVAIATSPAPVQATVTTPTMGSVDHGIATPTVSQDGTSRLVWGSSAQGRGIQVTLSPTTADEQWSLQRVDVIAVASLAGAEEP